MQILAFDERSDNIITGIFAITLMEYQECDRSREQRDRQSISLYTLDEIDQNDSVTGNRKRKRERERRTDRMIIHVTLRLPLFEPARN